MERMISAYYEGAAGAGYVAVDYPVIAEDVRLEG